MSYKTFYEELTGVEFIKDGSQIKGPCPCPPCKDASHLYVDPAKGICHCKKCGFGGNAWTAGRATGLDNKKIVELLERHSISTFATQDTPPKKMLSGDYELGKKAVPATDATIQRFDKAKSISSDAIRSESPMMSRDGQSLYFAGYTIQDGQILRSGYIQADADGRPIKLKNGGETKLKNTYGSRKGLLGLRAVKGEKRIIAFEGLGDWLKGIENGYTAISPTHGATSWPSEVNELFRDKVIYGCFDRDETGQKGFKILAKNLYGIAEAIYRIDLPYELTKSHGRDFRDYMAEHTKEDFDQLIAAATLYEPEAETEGNEMGDKEPTIAQKIMKIADKCEFFRADTGDVYLKPPGSSPKKLELRGGAGGSFLRSEHFKLHGVPVRNADLATVIETLRSITEEKTPVSISVRVSSSEDGIVIDLAENNNYAMIIERDGSVRIDDKHDVLFHRIDGITAKMERPRFDAPKADVFQKFHDMFGLSREDSFKLIAWAVQCWMPKAPFMILLLTGVPGDGKTTATGGMRIVVDPFGPGGAMFGRSPKEPADLMALAGACHVVAVDNLSNLTQEMSDCLAGLATRTGHLERKLFTNSDLSASFHMKPVILNGISPSGIRPDLRDRMIHVSLRHREINTPAAVWWRKYRELLPDLIGHVAMACGYGLKNLPNVSNDVPFRMADAVKWITACEPYFTDVGPWAGLTFADVYGRSRQDDSISALTDDPILRLFVGSLDRYGELQGNSSRILWALEGLAQDEGVLEELKRTNQWPRNARALSVKLQAAECLLRDAGIVKHDLSRREVLYQYESSVPSNEFINENEIIPA